MNVLILHCHFQRGGVTQVVENHVAALSHDADGRILLCSGGRADGLSTTTIEQTETIVIPELEYDELQATPPRASVIATRLRNALAQRGLSFADTVLHWHNPTLGKNVAIPKVISLLAQTEQARQFLQIHDFAEDYRPGNYLKLWQAAAGPNGDSADENQPPTGTNEFNAYCYPTGETTHYGTLTGGDLELLRRLGMHRESLHLIPNSVALPESSSGDDGAALDRVRQANALPADARWCIYPVRGIRRKNVGEFLLLSHLLPEPTYAGVTLPPATKIERRSYERWRAVGNDCAPKAIFDAGVHDNVSFEDNLRASDYVISTSVAEGFGMAFLEPWLVGRGVVARRLANVANDFVKAGVRLDRFYDAIWIPGTSEWISECRRESQAAFDLAWKKLKPELRPTGHPHGVDPGDRIDFATLTSERQIAVLRRMRSDSGLRNDIFALNAQLVSWLAKPFSRVTLEENRAAIGSQYSLEQTRNQLRCIYRKLSGSSADQKVEGLADRSVLDMLCRERTFFPCRTETEIAS